ncbi:pantoate--beta-alanine ligase [Verrucomicrobium sp. GAS474]|uniref:pantoate--beta-alanine ligase n=1 Tax=Verrucomicrobium sp. GAS474 TaxID=1882831 RepID=UPI000B82BE11|nr:pantoate--beta-alanine ligase [Verrucomicrobium sp. GAS474]
MRRITSPDLMQQLALRWKREKVGQRARIALVPTMGALHEGHAELIRQARKQAAHVIVSLYVNPTQFGPKEDLSRYPRPLDADAALCRRLGVDVLFNPANLYAPDHSTWVTEEAASLGRCGGSRPGHFRGVATVVTKLFALTQPDLAFFGLKDAQQLSVIERVVRDLALPVRIVPVEIVRDRDGLALSSRNRYLTPAERNRALALPLLLQAAVVQPAPAAWFRTHITRLPGLTLDYVEAVDGRLCAAIRVGKTRLIDNLPLLSPAPRKRAKRVKQGVRSRRLA